MDFVVDSSVVMSWAFEDESSRYAESVLDSLRHAEAVVPVIWPLEVANVLSVAGRRGRLTRTDQHQFLALVHELPIEVSTRQLSIREALDTARECDLSAYDASYLELARITAVPLATLDTRLRDAADRSGVGVWLGECAGG